MAKTPSPSNPPTTISAASPTPEPAFFSRQITEARRFYLQLDPSRSTPLAVICGGNEHCAADYDLQRAGFPYYTLEFVAHGAGALTMSGQTFPLMAGAVFAYGPRIAHHIRSSADRPMDKYFVNFTGPTGRKLLRSPAPQPGQIVQSSAPAHILQLFENLIAAGRRETPFREAICAVIVQHLLLRIAETAVPLGDVGTDAFETFQRCWHYIEAGYQNVQSLSEIAERCGVNEAYICRLFKRYAHQSPWQCVLRLKMQDAAHRLQMRQGKISQVAYELGYPDQFRFSRTFRSVFGMSPRQFLRLQDRQS